MTPFIVAEMSANHLRSLDRALAIVDAAAASGADAIKLQTWEWGTMCVDRTFEIDWHGKRRKLFGLYAEAHTPWGWHEPIFNRARELGLIPFSAAFDAPSVDFLETLGVDRHKVASFELTDLPLIRYMASKGKPMILSTGMATLEEISAAISAAQDTRFFDRWGNPITLLNCTSAYPADASDANLAKFAEPQGAEGDEFQGFCDWGLSDHSLGIGVAVAATALGAKMIEKHLTLSRSDGGPDAGFSMEPAEFKQMATECRRAAAAIGVPSYGPGPNESTALRRSLWVIRDIANGEELKLGFNVVTARPALGVHPDTNLFGTVALNDIKAGTPLTSDLFA